MVESAVEKELNNNGQVAYTQAPNQNQLPLQNQPAQPTRQGNKSQGTFKIASAKQAKYLTDMARNKNVNLNELLQQRFGISDISQLGSKQCSSLIDEVSGYQKVA